MKEKTDDRLYLVNITAIQRIAKEILAFAEKEIPKEYPKIKRLYDIDFERIAFEIEMRHYDNLWRKIGRTFLELLVKYYSKTEEYEKCSQIINGFNDFDAEQKRRFLEIDRRKQKKGRT